MKTKPLFLILFGFIILASGLWFVQSQLREKQPSAVVSDVYYCPMHPTYSSPKPGHCPICNMKLVKREPAATTPTASLNDKMVKQICVMHNCSHGSDGRPCPMMVVSQDGKSVSCPICGTHLVKDYENGLPGRSRIHLADDQRKLLGITTGDVLIKNVSKDIYAIAMVSDTHNVIEAQIYQTDLPIILKNQVLIRGLKVRVVADALPGQEFLGETRGLSRSLDPVTLTSSLRCIVHDPHWDLRPGMVVSVSIAIDLGQRLTVPVRAVFQAGMRQIVFLDQGKGVIEPREIKTGAKTNEDYEVLAGLEEGDVVLTSANFLIDSESQLKSAIASLSAQGGGHDH